MAIIEKRTSEGEELKKVLAIEPKPVETITTSIIDDGKQFSVRIPKKFAKVMHLDKEKDKFDFTIKIPPSHKEQPELTGKVIKG